MNNSYLYCCYCRSFDHVQIDNENGDILCMECGIILESRLVSELPDWNNYEQGVNKSRVDSSGGFMFNPNISLGSKIDARSCYNTISIFDETQKKVYFKKLSTLNTYIQKKSGEKKFDYVVQEMNQLASSNLYFLNKRSINHALCLWNELVSKNDKIYRASKRKYLIYVVIYYSLRTINGMNISRSDFIKQIGRDVDEKKFSEGEMLFKSLVRNLPEPKRSEMTKLYLGHSQVEDESRIKNIFSSRITQLKIKYEYVSECFAVYHECKQNLESFNDITERSRLGGVLYYVFKKNNVECPIKTILMISNIKSKSTLDKSMHMIETYFKRI